MIKKLIITPWFGDFPEWVTKYWDNIDQLTKYGYDWLPMTDLNEFKEKATRALGSTPDITPGTSRSHNFRTAFGLIFQEDLKGYDFWGITDLDCVYGDVSKFVPDDTLEKVDIQSNHHDYICGPWTLFRNNETINNLFKLVPNWKELMFDTRSHAGRWTEVEYSQMIDKEHEAGHINRLYTHYQGKDPNDTSNLSFRDGKLYDGEDEIMMFHFNRTKQYPKL